MSISGQIFSEMLAGYTQKTPHKPFENFLGRPKKIQKGLYRAGLRSQREFAPHAHFWQEGLLVIFLSEYPDKSHDFINFIFMTSLFSTLYWALKSPFRALISSVFLDYNDSHQFRVTYHSRHDNTPRLLLHLYN